MDFNGEKALEYVRGMTVEVGSRFAGTEGEKKGAEYLLALRGDPSSGTSLLSTTIQSLMLLRRVLASESRDSNFGSRVFAFTDNLDVINRLYHNLLDAEGWDSFGRPNQARALGSLANLRSPTLPNARERFEIGQNWAIVEDIGHVLAPGARVRVSRTSSQDSGVDANAGIVVATSALEVGLDDPEVGAVLQHKAPQSPAGLATARRAHAAWVLPYASETAMNLLVAAARAHHHDQFHIECAYVLPWKDHLVGQLESAGVRVHCLSSLRGDHRWPLRLRRLISSLPPARFSSALTMKSPLLAEG